MNAKRALWMPLRKTNVRLAWVLSPLFRYMRWYASRTPDEVHLLTVDPTSVDRIKLFPPGRVPVTGAEALSGAVGGPWDRLTVPLADHYVHQSITAYVERDAEWSETPMYDHPKYSDDPERARRRCERIERLLDSMAEVGYRSRFDADFTPLVDDRTESPNEWVGDVYVGDEIVVGLDRNGEPIQLKNGRHRLVAAQVLGVDRIPVVVSMFHPGARPRIEAEARPLSTLDDPGP